MEIERTWLRIWNFAYRNFSAKEAGNICHSDNLWLMMARVDPGFSVGGSDSTGRGGVNIRFGQILFQKTTLN